ncbi:agrin [Trichonephila clavata]|uniref:Agrin n=1 Tax=Trichonephila clavata TaxID=2740835 RepID=A0A8X6K9U7_TRICU|nr:agrin [Trichonephila clavata]
MFLVNHEAQIGFEEEKESAEINAEQPLCLGTCNCNRLGSYGESCDVISGQCECKTGVGGLRCDRCEPGYWGLHKIVADGNVGCLPCDCNFRGSARDDCEQMTGRCVCKHGILGMKCDICPEGTVLGEDGCMDGKLQKIFY